MTDIRRVISKIVTPLVISQKDIDPLSIERDTEDLKNQDVIRSSISVPSGVVTRCRPPKLRVSIKKSPVKNTVEGFSALILAYKFLKLDKKA